MGDKLHALKPWRWIFNRHPVTIWLIFSCASPVAMWVNDLLIVHGRVLHPNEQWLSAQFDFAVAAVPAILIALLRTLPHQSFPNWLRKWWVHLIPVVAGALIAFDHVRAEWDKTAAIGPNWLYHNLFLYLFLSYAVFIPLAAVVDAQVFRGAELGWRGLAGAMLVVVLLGGWKWAGDYDGHHQKAPNGVSKHFYANPPDPWCGGLLTRLICGPPER